MAVTVAAGKVSAPDLPDTADRDGWLSERLGEHRWFGGVYLDDGEVVVRSTEAQPSEVGVAQALASLTEVGLVSNAVRADDVRIEPARFSFHDLNIWKKSIELGFLALDGAVLTDLDEAENTIVLGYDSSRLDEASVRKLLAAAEAPAQAVTLRAVEPVVEESLRARSSALVGGLQITNPDAGLICTLGFTAIRASVTGFITNDHCTETTGSNDGNEFYQPSVLTAFKAGTEAFDPATNTDPGCPAGRVCRDSDAVFVASDAGQPTAVGWIANPDTLNDYTAWTGDARPVTSISLPTQGATIYQIGRTTGMTQGTITSTCVNVNAANTNITRMCQEQSSYSSAGGDSGGPVVAPDTSSPIIPTPWKLYGVHWGSGGTYSGIINVAIDIGSLLFIWG